MDIKLIRAGRDDADLLWNMQVAAFSDMYIRYRDSDTSPAAEPLEKTVARLEQPFTYYYFILADGETVGAVRVVDFKDPLKPKRISPIFIMPKYRGRGIAQAAITEAERLHGAFDWELETVLQEDVCCHLYEKMGYRRFGGETPINGRMTLISYRKD